MDTQNLFEPVVVVLLVWCCRTQRFAAVSPRAPAARPDGSAAVAEEAPVAVALSASRAPLPGSWWLSSVPVAVAAAAAVVAATAAVVEWLIFEKRMIIVRGADLKQKMCVNLCL